LYVSCCPPTLARDLADFRRLGFGAQRLTPLDMIPLSDAVEVLAELGPEQVAPPRVLFEDEALLVVDKPGHEPSASLLSRVRRLPGAERAELVGVPGTPASGIALFARAAEHVAALRQALVSAPREYVALCRGRTRASGKVERPLSGAKAKRPRTQYVRRELFAGHSLLAIDLTHEVPRQVERHLAAIGHPVLGDVQHGDAGSNAHLWHRFALDRSFLHLRRLTLQRPCGQAEFCAELPADLEVVLGALRAVADPDRF
jgi:23S rRNA (uracil1939-C5)-methyltransferase